MTDSAPAAGDAALRADVDALEAALRALGRLPQLAPFPIADLTLTLVPREEGLQSKDVPLEQLLKKLVSVRDKLRVLEQRVNSSDVPLDEKVRIQARVTSAYDAVRTLIAFFSNDALPAPDEPSDGASAGEPAGDV